VGEEGATLDLSCQIGKKRSYSKPTTVSKNGTGMHEELMKIEKMVFRLLSHKVLLSPSSNDLHPSISKTYGDEIMIT